MGYIRIRCRTAFPAVIQSTSVKLEEERGGCKNERFNH